MGLLDGARQRQQHRLEQVALAVEKIRTVGHFESLLGAAQQSRGLVTGQLHDLHSHALDAFADGLLPGVGVTPLGVTFDEDEIGNRLDGDQAVVRAVEVLVSDDGDAARSHLPGQVRLELVAESSQVGLEVKQQRVQGAARAGDEAIKLSVLQGGSDEAQATGALQAEGGEGGCDDSAEEGLASGAAKEGDEVGVQLGVSQCGIVTASPVAEGGARDAGVLGILSVGLWIRRAEEVVMGQGGLGSGPAERVCAWCGPFVTLRGSHGSCSLRVVVVNLP